MVFLLPSFLICEVDDVPPTSKISYGSKFWYLGIKSNHMASGGEFSVSVCIYVCIYTRKPGRSPTRQYGVLRRFLTCAPSLDFFGCFKKIFLLATQNQANPGHQGEKRWMGSLYTFLWNTGYITCLGMCKVCTEAVHSVAL